jgi:hypothetical protein
MGWQLSPKWCREKVLGIFFFFLFFIFFKFLFFKKRGKLKQKNLNMVVIFPDP